MTVSARPASAFLSLGANLGDREENLREALRRLGATPGIEVRKVAAFLETEPVLPEGADERARRETPRFINSACAIATTLSPRELFAACRRIETELGRDRGRQAGRWGPRPIDLDILLYGDRVVDEPDLKIPHPEMEKRLFVLAPLCEIAPEAVHPLLRRSVREMMASLPPQG